MESKYENKKLWQGAFDGAGSDVVEFNSSENIGLDQRLIRYDVLGSLAHVKMLAKQGILTQSETDSIDKALKQVLIRYETQNLKLNPELEDVHANIEVEVSRQTPAGKKMHVARSRNDQVLVDMRMYLRDHILELSDSLLSLQAGFASLAKKDGLMVGYTHTRVAQPLMVSFWCDAGAKAISRDIERLFDCYKRANQTPLGAGAIAGTSWPIDRAYTAELLGFDSVQENELDTISSRGEVEAELLSVLCIMMTRLSGLSEELIWLSEKGLIVIPDKFCTGSSMMPNKKNPDALELVRGRAGRVISNLMHVLTVKKGLISGYHSDLQETKYAVMEGIETSLACVRMLSLVIPTLEFDQSKIKAELETGCAQATEIADALTRKGVPFREAHGIVGKLVNDCREKGISLGASKPLPDFSAEEWSVVVMLEKQRLKRGVHVDEPLSVLVHGKMQKIQEKYGELSE